ncbi:MAG: hypothetical protein ACE5E6_04625 [Phycisphaerae bacterium]
MRVCRFGCVLVLLAGVATSVVLVRARQLSLSARALTHESAIVELRTELARLRAGVARLRAPSALRDRVAWFALDLVRPGETAPDPRPVRLAYGMR